jgi:hypothetical protein
LHGGHLPQGTVLQGPQLEIEQRRSFLPPLDVLMLKIFTVLYSMQYSGSNSK